MLCNLQTERFYVQRRSTVDVLTGQPPSPSLSTPRSATDMPVETGALRSQLGGRRKLRPPSDTRDGF